MSAADVEVVAGSGAAGKCCDDAAAPETPSLEELSKVLVDETAPVAKRTRAVFLLRQNGSTEAMDVLATALGSPSVLLGHEVAYVLGQMGSAHPVAVLRKVLQSPRDYHPIVRHEAAEALGAIGLEANIDLLEQHCSDADVEVSDTCKIAVDRLRFMQANPRWGEEYKSRYHCVDPAPVAEESDVAELKAMLNDSSLSLFQRYRAMFKLRDINSKEAVLALASGFSDPSPVFRHEVAYVFGQMAHPASVPSLVTMLGKTDEHSMVRHEAAEALGAVGGDDVDAILKGFVGDADRIVKESCDVALDIYDYWHLGIEGGCC